MKKSKKFIALSMVLMSVLGFGIVSNAQTLPFEFRIGHGGAGSSGPASKEDNEQNAYVTPVTVSGNGIVYAAVYGNADGKQYTVDTPISVNHVYRRTARYYITGHKNAKYYLIAQDSEYVVNGSLYAYGRWTL